ncbi:ABC transporter substrate-binding protein [Curtobacterium sp. MCSS17_011]|uniref:ABC transporter substrate-binding protein n=1 Tax=Curtobacterium sp. MCSS17_011 TaxID=2175643 RepID=UPI001C645892|nr:ABC transporter substrate-binding protein [Curtobacterium sp. MCSS17_011]
MTDISRRHMLLGLGATALTAGVGLGLAGCATGPATPIKRGTVDLRFWTHDPSYTATFQASVKDRSIQRGNRWKYDLSVTAAAAADLVSRSITEAVAHGAGPDLLGIVVDQFPRVMKSRIAENMFVSLNDLTDPLGADLLKTSSYTVDGDVYAIESDNSISGLFYRQDVFQKNGIPEDLTTWEELADAGTKLAKKTGQAIGMVSTGDAGSIFNTFLQLLLQRGGNVFHKDGSVALDSDESRDVLALMRRGVQDGFFTPLTDPYGGAVAAALKSSKLVGTVMPNWYNLYGLQSNVPEQKGKWRVRTIPRFANGGHIASSLGGTGFAVTKDTERTDAAVELLRRTYLTPEGQLLRYQKGGYMPTLTSLYDKPEFRSVTDAYLGGQPIFDEYAKAAKDMPVFNQAAGIQVMTVAMSGPILQVLKGQTTPDRAIASGIATYRDQVNQ